MNSIVIAMGRLGIGRACAFRLANLPEEVAAAVAFLRPDEASQFVVKLSGQILET